MRGGKLCLEKNDEDDIYTLGRTIDPVNTHVYIDANNEDILIKIVSHKSEYEESKEMSDNFNFVPKVYGFFKCEKKTLEPKYSRQQILIKAQHPYNKTQEELDELLGPPANGYIEKTYPVHYLVMERIYGHSFDSSSMSLNHKLNLLDQHISEIYDKYEQLCSKGVKWKDLFGRNIILRDYPDEFGNNIYFIDFDGVEFTGRQITPITPEKFYKSLRIDLKTTNPRKGGQNRIKSKKGYKSKRNKKSKQTKKYKIKNKK